MHRARRERRNLFVERILPAGVRRATLPDAVMNAYRGPFSTAASRRPTAVFPREILAKRERRRWEHPFPDHRTISLAGAGHYIQEDAAAEMVTAIRSWRSPQRP